MSEWRWREDRLLWSRGRREITLELLAAEGMHLEHARMGPLELEAEIKKCHDRITNLYWTFTRTARGKPPCVVDPEVHTRKRRLEQSLRVWNRLART